MDRVIVHTDRVATTGKLYSQAVAYGGLLYVSGQVALGPATGSVVQGFEAQTRRVLANLTAILEAGGSSRSLVLKDDVLPDRCRGCGDVQRGLLGILPDGAHPPVQR